MEHLAHAHEDDEIVDFSGAVDSSDLGRIKALTVLHELYMRIAQAEPIQLSSLTAQHAQLGQTPEITTDVSTRGNSVSEESFQGRRLQEWLTKWRRRSTSSIKDRRKSYNDRRLEWSGQEPHGRTEEGHRKQVSASLPLSTAQLSSLETNPWDESASIHATGTDALTSPMPPLSPTPSRPGLRVSSGSRTRSERTNNSTESLDYCKGANYLQRGFPKDAFKRTNQSVSMQAENYYWRCGNKQCVFNGPAVKSGKEWRFAKDIMHSSGTHSIEYRWSFLAKSHIPLGKVKGGWNQHTFKCFLCHLQGNNRSIFQGSRSFLDHTATHTGQYVGNTYIQGPLVLRAEMVKSLSDHDSEKFDVNIPPRAPTEDVGLILSPSEVDQPADVDVLHRAETADASLIFPISEVDLPADVEEKDMWYRPQDDADSGSINPWQEP